MECMKEYCVPLYIQHSGIISLFLMKPEMHTTMGGEREPFSPKLVQPFWSTA